MTPAGRRRGAAGCVAAAALLGSTAPAMAQAGGFVLLRGVGLEGNDAASTGYGRIDTGDTATEAAVLLEGQRGGLDWRVRTQVTGSTDDFPGTVDIKLQALSYGGQITDSLTGSIGKQQRNWGAGLSYQPIGFFRTQTNLRDPTDAEGRAEGLPMIYLARLADPVTLEAIYADELHTRQDGLSPRQWAVRASGQLGRLDTSALLRARGGAKLGAGGSFSWATTKTSVYGDVYWGPPERRSLVSDAALADRDVAFFPGGARRVSYVLGFTYTPNSRLTLTTELVRRGEGLGGARWSALVRDVRNAADGVRVPGPGTTAAYRRLAGALALLSGSGARRDYLFQRASLSFDKVSASVNATVGLADGGVALTATTGYALTPRLGLTASATRFAGGARSEFGLSPVRTVATIAVRRTFDF